MFLCFVNINTKFKRAFVRQCNYDAKKKNGPEFKPKGGNQKVSAAVGAGREAYGITIDGKAKNAQKKHASIPEYF